MAIGNHAIDLATYAQSGALKDILPTAATIFAEPALNAFAAQPWSTRRAVRSHLQKDLRSGNIPTNSLIPLSSVQTHLPMRIGGYSDFYTSLEHCQNCSAGMARSNIFKNWFYAPSVYNSRVSSVVPTGTEVRRPVNVYFEGGVDGTPRVGASRLLDFELEMGYFVSEGVAMGERMEIGDAKEHIFGESEVAKRMSGGLV